MNDETEMFFEKSEGSCYLESLARTRQYLKDTDFLKKLDEVILLEIDLAKMGAEKAKSEIMKMTNKDNVRPIK